MLAKLDSFLGSGDSSSLFAEAKATLESFKKVADNVNARIGRLPTTCSASPRPACRTCAG